MDSLLTTGTSSHEKSDKWRTINVILVRHGESLLNLKPNIWAGSTDSRLTLKGVIQAHLIAIFFSKNNFRFNHIYSSNLRRARSTALAISREQLRDNTPNFVLNPKLSEQHFGEAEGHECYCDRVPAETTLEELFSRNRYPRLASHQSFPGGESEHDLAKRARRAVYECIFPHLGEKDTHIAIVSHRNVIAEMVKYLASYKNPSDWRDWWAKMENTAWTRVELSVTDEWTGSIQDLKPQNFKVSFREVNQRDHINKHFERLPVDQLDLYLQKAGTKDETKDHSLFRQVEELATQLDFSSFSSLLSNYRRLSQSETCDF